MSEQAPRHESHKLHELAGTPETHHTHEKHHEEAEKHSHPDRVQELAEQAKVSATSASELAHKQPVEHAHASTTIDHHLKDMTLNRTLIHVRRHLSAPNRTLSRIIHQPAIEAVSDVASKTVARPSGFLGGSICAFLGSLTLLYVSKHYGYEYNFLVFGLLFVGGFFVGMLLELVVRLLVHKKST